jgi:hypothetical protein
MKQAELEYGRLPGPLVSPIVSALAIGPGDASLPK